MLIDSKTIAKISNLERTYNDLRFELVTPLAMEMAETREHFRASPHSDIQFDAGWRSIESGTGWGDNWVTAWFRATVTIPQELDGRSVFLRAETGAAEAMLLVDGHHRGVFDVNHPVRLLALSAIGGRQHLIAIEAYAGHSFPGTQPFSGIGLTSDPPVVVKKGCRIFNKVELVVERAEVSAFVFELRALHQLAGSLDENTLRRARLYVCLQQVFEAVHAKPEDADPEEWRAAVNLARRIMRPLLDLKNGPTAPSMGIIGHSHIDTAWLWPLAEGWRKCARTFSSILSLMEQYPEFKFLQSAPYHADMMRRLYPDIFKQMQQRVREGRWEINGAMWIEPDCNIPSGESFVRQCLVGQRASKQMFGVVSDTLWLPDVFGYSAALPQILLGCGVEFFCTTKLAWNDTNRFPYDTFHWQGIDGSTILAHFNLIHCWPDPDTLIKGWNQVQHKDVQDRRLFAFGYGDGGGGPQCEMIEMARLVKDLEGCPRTAYTTVSQFMRDCRAELPNLPRWVGELYLELHRGTLTSIAAVKRGNRKCEFALRDAEFICTLAALGGADYPHEALLEIWKKLLLNQFHDILPGSSIAEVNTEAIATFDTALSETHELRDKALRHLCDSRGTGDVLLANSLSWDRGGELELDGLPDGLRPAGDSLLTQRFQDIEGRPRLAVTGMTLPSLGYEILPLTPDSAAQDSPFETSSDCVRTPFAQIRFDAAGRIISFVDVAAQRELVASGGFFNSLLLGEDVPATWDNWDTDRDQRLKLLPQSNLLTRSIVADGPLQLRVRSEYRIGRQSTLKQDIVFHSTTPRVDFETHVDWKEKYQFLKVGFSLAVLADSARHEIQFGHVARPTHDNTTVDRAQFDVCAHKWTDISETGYGVAFLNDCKYACTVKSGEYRLSLIKSGRHPDPRGDEGMHRFTYSMLPHNCDFSVESVVRPAYELNVAPVAHHVRSSALSRMSLAQITPENVIIESVKWAEEGKALILRVYEAARTAAQVKLQFGIPMKSVTETNLLEQPGQPLELANNAVQFPMRAFEIKTLRCQW